MYDDVLVDHGTENSPSGRGVLHCVFGLLYFSLGSCVRPCSCRSVVVLSSVQVRVRSYGYAFRGVVWYAFLVWVDTGIRLACTHLLVLLEVCKRPWSLHGSRGTTAGTAAYCTPYNRYCPFFPVQSQPTELPATTEEGGGDATSRLDTRQDR